MRGSKRMKTHISASQHGRGTECAKSHYYWYQMGYRPVTQSAALLFGSAVEAGINELVLGKSDAEVRAAFDKKWSFQEINGVYTHLPRCKDIVYAESDFDDDLLTADDRKLIETTFGITDLNMEIARVYEDKKYAGFLAMPDDRKEFLNFINWVCLYRKALYMFDAVRENILPLITEVLSVQERIEIQGYDAEGNPTDDSILGFIDMVVRLKDVPYPVVLDWKTSSREYDPDSVRLSTQLSVYVHAISEKYENTRFAAYGVLQKHMTKTTRKICTKCGADGSGKKHKTCDAEINGERCHGVWDITITFKARVNLLVDQIPEHTENIVLENMAQFNQLIKNGIFIRNFNACDKPWGRCPFFAMCRENKGDDGLIKVSADSKGRRNENVPLASHGR